MVAVNVVGRKQTSVAESIVVIGVYKLRRALEIIAKITRAHNKRRIALVGARKDSLKVGNS